MQQILDRVSIKSAAHLKAWLIASGRQFIVFPSGDLVDALPWPGGVEALIQIVEAFRQHRVSLGVEWAACPRAALHRAGQTCDICRNQNQIVARTKTDALELDEMKAAAVFLLNQVREKEPTWNPF